MNGIGDILRAIDVEGVPPLAKVVALFLLVGGWVLARTVRAAAETMGIHYQFRGEAIVELQARILRMQAELERERKRVEHEAASRDAADKRIYGMMAEQETLLDEVKRLRRLVGRETGEFPALPGDKQ